MSVEQPIKETPQAGERVCNILTGASVLSWGVLGLVYATPDDRWSVTRISITMLHFVVGALFLTRHPLRSQASWNQMAACIPSFVAGGIVFKLSAPCGQWPAYAQVLFGIAAAGTCISLANLGRSFSVLPAKRDLVVSGPYSLVRHPAYACELTMLAACVLANPTAKLSAIAAAALLFMVLRIFTEEHFLSSDNEYAAYMNQVRSRLVPGLW